MKDAVRRHDDAVKNESQRAKDINIRQSKQKEAARLIDERKADLQRVENQQEINAQRRDDRLAQLSATSATGPSAA